MKKIGIILFLLIFLIINLFLIQVKAEEIDPETGLPVTIKDLSDTGEKLTDKNASYLAGKWRDILLKNPVGYSIVKIWDFSKPVLTVVIGRKAEISWGFAIALALWLLIFFGARYIFTNFSAFSKTTAGLISLGIVVIMAVTKLTAEISGFLDNLLSKWWGKVIVLLALIILIVLAVTLTRSIEKIRKELQVEEDKAKLHAAAQSAEGFKKAEI